MGHGWPDYKRFTVDLTVHPVKDVGEGAVRLGSIDYFDRRGAVFLLDSFEEGIDKWKLVPQGTGAEIHLSAATARNGTYSAKIVTSATSDQRSHLFRGVSMPTIANVGLECAFAMPDGDCLVALVASLYTGTTWYMAELQYREDESKLYVYDSAGTYQEIASGVILKPSQYVFHNMKFVMDLKTGKYVRAIVGPVEYDISTISFYSLPTTAAAYMEVRLAAAARAAASVTVYFDDVILSGHESASMLQKLNDLVIKSFLEKKIEFARVFCQSSNVFATYYEIWVKKDLESILKAIAIIEGVKRKVDFYNPIYSTGIIMPRKSLQTLRKLGFNVRTDSDLFELIKREGDKFIDELLKRLRSRKR